MGIRNGITIRKVGVDISGFPGLSDREDRSHFSMWSMMASPLLSGNNLRDMSESTKVILTNKEVIAVDQDPAGTQGHKIKDDGDQEVWIKPLEDGDRVVVLLNRGEDNEKLSTDAKELGFNDEPAYIVRDLWDHEQSVSNNKISAYVPSHGVAMFRVKPGTMKKMQTSVEQFDEEGEFNNGDTVHALNMHLIAVEHYEKKGSAKKVVKHMKGFKSLLGHQKENDKISKKAYTTLKNDSDSLIQIWKQP